MTRISLVDFFGLVGVVEACFCGLALVASVHSWGVAILEVVVVPKLAAFAKEGLLARVFVLFSKFLVAVSRLAT